MSSGTDGGKAAVCTPDAESLEEDEDEDEGLGLWVYIYCFCF